MDTPTVRETDGVAASTGAASQKAELGEFLATAAAQAGGSERLPSCSGFWQVAQVDGMLGHEDELDLGWRIEPVTAFLEVPAVPVTQGAAAGTGGPA